MFGDLLGVSLLIFEDYVDDAGARLEGRVSNAAELFQALQIENEFVDHLMAVFFTVWFVVGCQLGVMTDGEMGDEVLLDVLFVNEAESVGGWVQSKNVSFLGVYREMGCPHVDALSWRSDPFFDVFLKFDTRFDWKVSQERLSPA